jgi:hypothetical protein
MENILSSNPTSGAVYNFCYGITTGEPIQPIGKNRGLLISHYDSVVGFAGITICFFRPNGTTFTQEFKLSRTSPAFYFKNAFLLECQVYGVGGMGTGVTCAAIA